jgi:hypothetical protein
MMQFNSERERRLVLSLVPALLLSALVYYLTEPSAAVAPSVDSGAAIELAKTRLDRARSLAALLPARQDTKKSLEANLAQWEKRLITADTAAQAQVQLNQLFRRIARAQGPAVEVRGMDIGTVQPANDYTEILVSATFDCQVEGLVNLLTDLSSQPEFLTWRDLRINSTDSKQKRITVSMLLVAIGPAKLIARPTPGARG